MEQRYVYSVLIEFTHRRNYWYYLGTYHNHETAYTNAIRREREYLLDTPNKRISRFQIQKKRHKTSSVYHTELYVRHAARETQNLYDQAKKAVYDWFSSD